MDLQDTSVFDAHSPQARAIAHLFYYDLAIAAVIFLTVAGLVAFIAIRFRQKSGGGEPFQDPGNPKLETLWTVIPALILLSLLIATGYTMSIVNPPVVQPTPNVIVIAHQWWWEYHYPASGVVTANELHMPLDQKWLLRVQSADVIHDFWVPDLGAKVDAIPNHPNYLWIRPERAGIYWGTCAEFCGAEHALMAIRVFVQPAGKFEQWQAGQLRIPAKPEGADAQRGEQLFEQHTCMNCHTIAGTKAKGKIGPNLTHVADRQTLGSGAINNTPGNLTLWIEDPQKIKPGINMPSLKLTHAQAHDIAVYLEALK